MFCSKCGCRNADGAAFCQNCGTKLVTVNAQPDAQQPTVQPTYQQPTVQPTYQQPTAQTTYQQPAYQQPAYQQPAKNPVGLAVLKRVCSSPVALVAIIAYTAAAVFNVINSFISGAAMANLFRLNLENGLSDDAAQAAAGIAGGTTFISTLIGMTPTILIVVGLWMAYSSAASRKYTGMKTSGLTMVKVTLIVELVFASIALGLVLIVLLLAIAVLAGGQATWEPDDIIEMSPGMAVTVIVLAAIIIAVVMTLMIIFYVKAVKSINTIKMTALTGNPSANVSTFVAVMSFILGGSAALSVFGNLFSANIIAVLLSICSATAYIAFGIFLFSYRSQMRTAMFGGEYTGMMQKQSFDEANSFAFDPPVQTSSTRQNVSEPQNVVTAQPTASPNAEPQQDDSQQDEL